MTRMDKNLTLWSTISLVQDGNPLHNKWKYTSQYPMVPWGCGYLYCITSFIKASTQALHWCKSWLWHVGDLQWWGSVTMVPSGNRAKCLLSVNHITKIHHHHTWFSYSTERYCYFMQGLWGFLQLQILPQWLRSRLCY